MPRVKVSFSKLLDSEAASQVLVLEAGRGGPTIALAVDFKGLSGTFDPLESAVATFYFSFYFYPYLNNDDVLVCLGIYYWLNFVGDDDNM